MSPQRTKNTAAVQAVDACEPGSHTYCAKKIKGARPLHTHPARDLSQALTPAAKLRRTPGETPRDQDEYGPHTNIGTFTRDQAPSSLKLTRATGALHLWRRGTRDPLTRSGPDTYSGNGYTLTRPDCTDTIGSFTLDLKRAPAPHYIHQ